MRLAQPGPLVVDDIFVSPGFPGWRERVGADGERQLRQAALERDPYAMERLGSRLLSGHGLTQSIPEGCEWLRQSAISGSPVAMLKLAEHLLVAGALPEEVSEGERLLLRAVELRYLPAMVSLGGALIVGSHLPRDAARGRKLLNEAARHGSQLAHIRLAAYLLSGRGLTQDRPEGMRWLRRAGAVHSGQIVNLGYYLYIKSLTAAPASARELVEAAGVLLHEALRCGHGGAGAMLAYLQRRGEITALPMAPFEDLLAEPLRQGNAFAAVNQALRLAKGVQCAVDWPAADLLIERLRAADEALAWWNARSLAGDPEGHLVVFWLGRHHVLMGIDESEYPRRMELAQRGGWDVPEWLTEAV